jgi:hypothetical protein
LRSGWTRIFDTGTVTIGDDRIPLQNVNAVLVDGIDRSDGRHLAGTLQVESRVPLAVDAQVVRAHDVVATSSTASAADAGGHA